MNRIQKLLTVAALTATCGSAAETTDLRSSKIVNEITEQFDIGDIETKIKNDISKQFEDMKLQT
jgi:hypothetical protein